jgi:hypothetical protein
METITITVAIGLILAIAGAAWRLASYIRKIEKEITNDTRHHLLRIEGKIDDIKEDIGEVKERVARLEG